MRQSSPSRIIAVGIVSIILALVIGLGLGLLASRGVKPPGSANQAIASLSVHTKEAYIVLVGAAYARDRDLALAQARLDPLDAPNIQQWVSDLAIRYLAEGRDEADIRALAELAHGLGSENSQVLAYLATLTPPTPTPAPTDTPTITPAPPTALPPTDTPQPTDTPLPPSDTPAPEPSDTPIPSTPTPQPTDTARPQPTNTPKPEPTATNPPAAKWTWSARLLGPGEENQTCTNNPKFLRVTVLDAAGSQIPNVWVHEQYTGQYQVTGHKGDDPYWGPGEAEFSSLDGGVVCIATGQGGPCESEWTRDLPCHSSPPFEDLWAAGYCECCKPGITKEECQALFDEGNCVGGIGNFAWRVEFKRSW